MYEYTKSSDGEYAKYRYAVKVDTGTKIESTGSDLAELAKQIWSCEDIVGKLTDAGRVAAVRTELETYFLTCTDAATCGPSSAAVQAGLPRTATTQRLSSNVA